MAIPRIAIGSIFTECNQLGGVPIDLGWFERYELHRGDAILTLNTGVAVSYTHLTLPTNREV